MKYIVGKATGKQQKLIYQYVIAWDKLIQHSMAKDNLNKSKETTQMTSAALKVAP